MLLDEFAIPTTFRVNHADPLNEIILFKKKPTPPSVRFLITRPDRTTVEIGSKHYHIRRIIDATTFRSFTEAWTVEAVDGAPLPKKREYPSVKEAVQALVAVNTN